MAFQETSFARFWRHYLHEHSRAGTRAMHYIGSSVGIVGGAITKSSLPLVLHMASLGLAMLVLSAATLVTTTILLPCK